MVAVEEEEVAAAEEESFMVGVVGIAPSLPQKCRTDCEFYSSSSLTTAVNHSHSIHQTNQPTNQSINEEQPKVHLATTGAC